MKSSHTRTGSIESILESFYTIKRKLSEGVSVKPYSSITPSQSFALWFIARHGAVGVKDIAKAFHMTSSGATQVADELVKKGYIIRRGDPKDRRATSLSLTPKAKS